VSAPQEAQFARLQRAFAAHLRDPEQVAPPGEHDPRRLDVYRYAVYANIERFMRDNYPRVRAVMNDAEWHAMVRDYLVRHVARASAFVDLPKEFLAYLEHEREPDARLPFLFELAHFDWLETLVGADPRRVDHDGIDRDGDLIAGVPVANPVMVMHCYRYPVHAINAEYLPLEPPAQPTRIAAFRDTGHEYGFLDLNAASARLLELIMLGEARSGREIFATVAAELGSPDVAGLIEAGGTILARMLARDVILGARRA
jgi:hypothetical protein